MRSIQHIAFNCRDIEKQEAFYVKHFGFKRCRVFNEGESGEFIMLRLGDMRLELFSATEGSGNESGKEQPVGFKHLAFEVENIEQSIEALKQDGIETGDILDCSKHLPGMRVCFFDDLEGNKIELMEGYKDQF